MLRKFLALAVFAVASLSAVSVPDAYAQPTVTRPQSLPPQVCNARAITTLTIATGSVTASQCAHLIDTEAAASTDDLTTVVPWSNVLAGQTVTLSLADATYDVVIKNGSGANLISTPDGGDWPLGDLYETVTLRWTGSQWRVVAPYDDLEDDLASTANGLGASKIGIEDAGASFTATNVETGLAELKSDIAGIVGAQWQVVRLSTDCSMSETGDQFAAFKSCVEAAHTDQRIFLVDGLYNIDWASTITLGGPSIFVTKEEDFTHDRDWETTM